MAARKPKPKQPKLVHVEAAEKYVADVLSEKIPACKWVKLACERHKKNIASSITKAYPYRFDPEHGDKVCRFFEKLPHVKGKWARLDPVTRKRQTLKLQPWQAFIFVSIFGWVHKKTGKRRFRKARIYVPRKNGKSFIASAVGWWMFARDGEPGAEVYAGATSEAQAWKVFEPARQMAKLCPNLPKACGVTVNAQTLVKELDGSIFKPIIGKPGDGDSPHCAITDEYHEHSTSDQLDTMETGMGAREQPLSMVISTAGADVSGPCREDWQNCEKILECANGFEDETTFCIIYTIDQGDRWDCKEALMKANPNWGVSIEPIAMMADMKSAQQRASRQGSFKTKHLNLWVSVKEAFFNLAEWNKLGRKIKRADYKEFPCYLSGDLASKHDLVALMQLFCLPNDRYALFGKYYIPEATLNLPENQHYRNWHIAGWIETAGEEVTDLDHFKEDVLTFCKDYKVEEMPSDPNRAWGVFPALEKEGIPMVEYRNTVLTMSEPMKELDALIRSGRIIHCGDPVLAWAISNTTGKIDKKDNVFPNKESPTNKIDPVVGTIMALGRAMLRDKSGDETTFFNF